MADSSSWVWVDHCPHKQVELGVGVLDEVDERAVEDNLLFNSLEQFLVITFQV